MSTNRDTKILEAILFASGSPILEDDLKDKMLNKKVRFDKEKYVISDYQKSERDFAFVIDKTYKVGDLELLIKIIRNWKKLSSFGHISIR